MAANLSGSMTAEEFENAAKYHRNIEQTNLNAARMVLVDGRGYSDAAKTANAETRQAVYSACLTIVKTAASHSKWPEDWRRVVIYVPPEKAAEVEREYQVLAEQEIEARKSQSA
jgi:hypothetical protein